MRAISRFALTLGLALSASAAPNSIVALTGAEKLTVGLLGGMLIISLAISTSINTETKGLTCIYIHRLRLDRLASSAFGLLQQCLA